MRSLLFVPGDSERKMAKALGSGADALILDLEDSVTVDRKPHARALTTEFLKSADQKSSPHLCVRINGLDTPHWRDDLDALSSIAPQSVLLPKASGGDDIRSLADALNERGLKETKIIALITEVPISLLRLETYVGASDRVIGLTWGAEDLSVELGATANRDDGGRFASPYQMVRNLCLITAAAAGTSAIDTVFTNFRDDKGLEREATEAARDGFTGKLAIHPGQVEIINAAFTPTEAQVERARAVLAAFASLDASAGVASLDGEMLDEPHRRQAERLLNRAGQTVA